MTINATAEQIREEADGLTLRTSQILWLDTMLAGWDGERLADTGLDDLIDGELDARHLDASMEPFRDLLEIDLDDDDEADYELNSSLNWKFLKGEIGGFLLKAEQPIFYSATETGCSFSWGHYRTRWLMAPTVEQAWELAKQWGRANLDKAIAETREKKAEAQ